MSLSEKPSHRHTVVKRHWTMTGKVVRKKAYENVGRNEQCPCGSGKKFKRCCINLTIL